jgi:hypothetical protein
MKSNYKVAVAMLAGVALGALVVQGLHAQAKPPIYVVTEIDVSNLDAYLKEYVPLLARHSLESLRASPLTPASPPRVLLTPRSDRRRSVLVDRPQRRNPSSDALQGLTDGHPLVH